MDLHPPIRTDPEQNVSLRGVLVCLAVVALLLLALEHPFVVLISVGAAYLLWRWGWRRIRRDAGGQKRVRKRSSAWCLGGT